MESNVIEYEGKIIFDPENITRKHEKQAEWKKVAMVVFGGDLSEYYAWFLYKNFNLILNKELRPPHVTFINDWYSRDSDLPKHLQEKAWEDLKAKYHKKKIKVKLSLDYHTNGNDWWLIVKHDSRGELHRIRAEVGLGKPFFGLHMTIGHVDNFEPLNNHPENKEKGIKIDNTKYIQSKYIQSLGDKGFIELKEKYPI